MATRLFDRVSTLLRADAHGVVDALEERSLLLRQHLREAELEIMEKRARADALREEEERTQEALRRRSAELSALDEDVSLALAGGKQDLARFATGRWLAGRRDVESLESRAAELCSAREKLEERLAGQERRFESLKTRSRSRLVRARETTEGLETGLDAPVTDEEIDLELLRRSRAEEA